MPTAVTALSVAGPDARFATVVIERREPGPTDVVVDLGFVGVCHSDVHAARNDWGFSTYPLVPGHEMTGVVSGVGAQVTRYAVGDRVAVGNLLDSCRDCGNCARGLEQYCLRGAVGAYNSVDRSGRATAGGFSQRIVVDQDFVLRLPAGMDPAAGAPLLCAGITMYSALREWRAGPGMRVAIAGMGGLGHVGVRIAAALGADVTVLSRTLANAADARRFGATQVYATTDGAPTTTLAGTFDLIISTVSATSDTAPLLNLLTTDGTLVMAGAPVAPLTAPVGLLIGGRRRLAGTSIGGIAQTQEMLDFCAAHGIVADVEVIPADRIHEAYRRLDAGDVRYRFVLDVATLRGPAAPQPGDGSSAPAG
ncbi:NAD(P)-dependent alcohol dehydrogenase [Jidongwangia harbinensis]|uniref:NAD(P)-dependent alcohol dehydrogenase n=1 Tax=Jidongwangia harbinensis TaxID=2878561 RepID=UPI001CD973FB|nr:NAD(P)-dependent alcohol dehydrogenase [Jidongwangia harbinensis]MCA2219181.1 NAD(P)-dependent alcohol dehydrogenase [Jidongwangia harbinensis]